MNKRAFLIIFLILTILILTSCVPGGGEYNQSDKAGFFSGVWHGWIAPISLILGLVKGGYRIYEVNNVGWLYDFGFYIAIISGFGGISLFRKKKED